MKRLMLLYVVFAVVLVTCCVVSRGDDGESTFLSASTQMIAGRMWYDKTDDRTYEIEFKYSTGGAMIPATMPPGCPHYAARITVYRMGKGGAREKVGLTFDGYFTGGKCWEDQLEPLVEKAKNQETAVTPVEMSSGILLTNSIMITFSQTNFCYSVTNTSTFEIPVLVDYFKRYPGKLAELLEQLK